MSRLHLVHALLVAAFIAPALASAGESAGPAQYPLHEGAGAKKQTLPPQVILKGQADFYAVTMSDEYAQALKAGDFDTMKQLVHNVGIQPSPDFPVDYRDCLPPSYWINYLGQIYGPNPDDGNKVELYLGWLPRCVYVGKFIFNTFTSPY
jgi:hypothetical protein